MAAHLDRLRVVLVRTRNPLNIGAVARAMSNFGFSCLRLVNPYEPSFREARSAMGGAEVLADAEVYKSVGDAVADCALVVGTSALQRRVPQQAARRLETGARLLRRSLASAPAALLFGSEKVGLSNEDLSHCHWVMRIPTREQQGSMNLGQAAAVCLYELIRITRASASTAKPSLAHAVDLERITSLLGEALAASGYAKAASAGTTEQALRRMVRRLKLSPEDARIWLAMLRQITWKLGRPHT